MAACQGQVHAFDSQDLIDVYIPDGPETILYRCEQQPCPNRTPRSIEEDYPHRCMHVNPYTDERNTRSDPEAPSHLDLPRGTLALSPLPPASLKLSPSPVKLEEISLQTLRQSQSLRRVQVKKESRSPSPRILLGPPRRQRSPPRQQSLTYVTPPPNFLRRLHRRSAERPLEHSLLSKFDQRKATTAASAPAASSVPPDAGNVVPRSRPRQGDPEAPPPPPL
ncbi:predicted protein [Postia placenta Mad-698-R]|nr:predicted protein [Postia placenta Mad-698-R]